MYKVDMAFIIKIVHNELYCVLTSAFTRKCEKNEQVVIEVGFILVCIKPYQNQNSVYEIVYG